MLINMKEMLEVAEQNHFAVGAFNATESSLFRSVVEEAEALGADGIVNIRYSSSAVMQGAAEVIAYGTAVKFLGEE